VYYEDTAQKQHRKLSKSKFVDKLYMKEN